ncbi:MAG: LacI family transcriptional regulator [Clostridia bacterium]|jgi:LacI family sucrose operon transcriptional repressor|nr:LacI family transcriptional regulator [Clostridia bacterium]
MASIKDVARIAGVTPTTVSRVLNNRGYISENTRKQVYDAMQQLNYQPNRIARSLQSSKSDIIAILVPDSGSMFYSGLISQVEWQCRKRDKRLLLCNSYTDPKLEHEYIRILNGQGIDGLIVCSHTLDIEHYERVPFKLVTFDRVLPNIPMVASDNFAGGQMAAKRLIDKGCTRLLHISGPMTNARLAGHDRYRGFADYCNAHGVSYELFQTEDKFGYNYYASFVADRLQNKLTQFDGAFCSNDMLAYALYRHAVSQGLCVPQDLKIVGFDNSQFVRILADPKITVVAQDETAIAEALVRNLLSSETAAPITTVPVRLVEGTTA